MASSYTLGTHFEAFIRKMVASGRYASASEVVREGLRLMEEREDVRRARLEALRVDLQAGLDSGEPEALDIDAIRAEARDRQRRKVAAAWKPVRKAS